MGRLTDDMTRLRDEVNAMHGAREVFINKLKHGVSEMKAGVEDMQSGFRNDRFEMARNMKANLGTFVSGLKDEVSELAEDASAMRAGFCRDHAEMAEKLKDNLGAFVSGLKDEVSEMQSGFRNDRFDMARNMKADLRTFLSGIKESVSQLAEEVSDMQSGFRRDRAEMAAKTSTERKMFLSELRQSLSNLRHEIAFLRNKFAADISGARQAWFQDLPAKTDISVEKKVEEEHPFEAPEHRADDVEEPHTVEDLLPEAAGIESEEEENVAETIFPDDFTVIKGIGVGRQNLLNEAGIFTYAQLAESNPEKLLQVLGPMAKTAMVEKWIRQAGELKIDD